MNGAAWTLAEHWSNSTTTGVVATPSVNDTLGIKLLQTQGYLTTIPTPRKTNERYAYVTNGDNGPGNYCTIFANNAKFASWAGGLVAASPETRLCPTGAQPTAGPPNTEYVVEALLERPGSFPKATWQVTSRGAAGEHNGMISVLAF